MAMSYYNPEMMAEWMQQGAAAGAYYFPQPMLLPITRNGRVLIPMGTFPHTLNGTTYFGMEELQSAAALHIHGEGPPQMRKLFIGGLNHETTDEQLRQYYSKWGPVVDSIVIREPNSKQSRGFGFVTFGTLNAAEAALNDRPHLIGGKTVDSKRAIPREQMMPLMHTTPFLDYDVPAGCKLTITGIHCDFHSVEALRVYFEKFGPLDQVEILGKPRGVGFVIFERREDAERCLAHKGGRHYINEKRIDVRPFQSQAHHVRMQFKRRMLPPLIPLMDQFAAMNLQPYPLMQYPVATPGYSEEESSYGCTTEDESKVYEESEQENSDNQSSPECSDSSRKDSSDESA